MNKLAQGFNVTEQDSNPGPLGRVPEALLLIHCALIILFLCRITIGPYRMQSSHSYTYVIIVYVSPDCQ